MKCRSLQNLIPKYTVTLTSSSETDNWLELYQQDVDSKTTTFSEIMRWKEKWEKQNIATLLTNAVDALEGCNADLFPNVRKLLSTMATLPVTTVVPGSVAKILSDLQTFWKRCELTLVNNPIRF